MSENPWNSERGRAARLKMCGEPLKAAISLGPNSIQCHRDDTREWLVERGWTLTCNAEINVYTTEGDEMVIEDNYDLALIAAVEATKE